MRIKKTSQYIEGGAGLPSYFTTEIDTGMKWIDGKTIYRRCADISSITSSNSNIVDVSSWNIENIISLTGFIKDSYNNINVVPMYDSASNYSVLFFNGTYLRGRASIGTGGTISNAYAIVEYTKTS